MQGGGGTKGATDPHPYIVGNTMYSYLSEYCLGKPSGSDIEGDTRDCAAYYNKLRFSITGDIYPDPCGAAFPR